MLPILIALKEYGTYEWIGKDNNPRVLEYFKEAGHAWVKDDETAWCAAFVNWVLKKAGKMQTGSLAARSFLTYGTETATPELGDIVVLWRESKTSPFGHVGFYVKETPSYVYILGGNQSDMVNITRFPKTNLLSFRKIPLVTSSVV